MTFRDLHHADQPLLLPNAWDYASAAALAVTGRFAAIGTTSLGVAVANGLPDAAGAARAETVALARLLGRLDLPVTVDIESGFSDDPADVAELVTELAAAGIAGVNLEDGRPGGVLADPDTQCALLRAVKSAAPELFLNARTDTRWLGVESEPPLGDTLARAERYLAAGADGIFVPGLAEDEHIRELVAAVPAPVNILFLPGRHSVRRLAELGVRRISTGSLLFRAAVRATVAVAQAVADDEPLPGDIPGYADAQALVTG